MKRMTDLLAMQNICHITTVFTLGKDGILNASGDILAGLLEAGIVLDKFIDLVAELLLYGHDQPPLFYAHEVIFP